MSETTALPAAKGLMRKRIAGVPVLYIIGGAVVIVAVYAWKTKTTTAATTTTTATETAEGQTTTTEAYPEMETGTVVVSTPTTTATSGLGSNSSITSNDEWIKAGMAYLIAQGYSAGDVQVALQTYLAGSQLTIAQGKIRDITISQYGAPPTLPDAGVTGPTANTGVVLGYIRRPYGNETNGIYAVHSNHTLRWTEGRVPGVAVQVKGADAVEWTYPLIGDDAPVKDRG